MQREFKIGRAEVLITLPFLQKGDTKRTGRIALEVSDAENDWRFFGVHLFPDRDSHEWGFGEDWYNGPIYSFGAGPLALIVWSK